MATAPPGIPQRFPCWCRAVYSYGGESKRDLGFIEGDLIECLNAGDGSWWTGRLRRDRRMVGLFPSNFVEVLPDDFRPISRSTSPMAAHQGTPSPQNTPQKQKTFRKPFEAYSKAPHYTSAKQPETYRQNPARPPQENLPSATAPARSPFRQSNRSVQSDIERIQTPPRPRGYGSRSRQPSPALGPAFVPAPSPVPSYNGRFQQSQFADPFDGQDDAPPPPPPHRHVAVQKHGSSLSYDSHMQPRLSGEVSRHGSTLSYDARISAELSRHGSRASYDGRLQLEPNRHGSHASYDDRRISLASYDDRGGFERRASHFSMQQPPPAQRPMSGYHTPRAASPCPPSPGGSGVNMTPSPLREAMDGVMEQLDALGTHEAESPEEPPAFDPWSPESFDMVNQQSRRKRREATRPQTSIGMALNADSGYGTGSGGSSREPTYHGGYQQDAPLPQLGSYVERMDAQLRNMHSRNPETADEADLEPPPPPPKSRLVERPKSSMDTRADGLDRKLRHKRSAKEVGKMIGRTFTTKTNSSSSTRATDSSTGTQSTNRSLMSGVSAGGISATSAGSLARKTRSRAQSALGVHDLGLDRPETPFSGVTYHSSHASDAQRPISQAAFLDDPMGNVGGLAPPTPKKKNFLKKLMESAKTGVASGRSSIMTGGSAGSLQSSPMPPIMPSSSAGISSVGFSGPVVAKDASRDMGLASGTDWVQVRRDVNRSNTLSRNERNERKDRCMMLDYPALDPVDELYGSIEGDEDADGLPVRRPMDYSSINFTNVDKNSRFIKSLPPMTTPITLSTTYVCRPYRSDVQRLRAIFTWVAELVTWEEDYEGDVDTRRVIQTKRGCAEEYAVLVMEMCGAVGLHCEVVRGYLKTPGEIPETNMLPRPNHWWNAVLLDGHWRIMDCCLASPSNPKRALFSSVGSGSADFWYFLARPSEICWTHMPEHHEQQHVCPPVANEVLLNLPCACPPYFVNNLQMFDYNTSLTRIEDLEMVHIKFNVPADVEVAAEVEVRALSRDEDGDFFESGDLVRKRALAQCEWFSGSKRYTVKALLPGDEGHGTLKIYAGKRGLMHSIKDIPHPMAFAIPIIHTGENPAYEFVLRHPTPHAQRHDIYVVQPQCQRLALNNTFVFAIRQHPSSAPETPSSITDSTSPVPFVRPGSAMSISATSNPSSYSGGAGSSKPAKLAIQTPGGKILRLMRKEDRRHGGGSMGSSARGLTIEEEVGDGGTWETIIKCSERGVWRGLVLADRIAKWCVFAEWHCVG
ncbi:variant SH3 domain-containing protein [Diaporthe helianthi]|uniref:Variant SH3 domain-containing protein n=1 Tax=Diaporthe helianthi TaxID=158607 RepID=A0A2P5I170_DIAHE|nr:variant SH3 domain-containing protein [Diaporthe helianthi]